MNQLFRFLFLIPVVVILGCGGGVDEAELAKELLDQSEQRQAENLKSFTDLKLDSLNETARRESSTLTQGCKMYKLRVGSFPQQLNDLHVQPTGLKRTTWGGPYLDNPVQTDPWRNVYNYEADELNNVVLISSSGPDGVRGNDDDISSEPISK